MKHNTNNNNSTNNIKAIRSNVCKTAYTLVKAGMSQSVAMSTAWTLVKTGKADINDLLTATENKRNILDTLAKLDMLYPLIKNIAIGKWGKRHLIAGGFKTDLYRDTMLDRTVKDVDYFYSDSSASGGIDHIVSGIYIKLFDERKTSAGEKCARIDDNSLTVIQSIVRACTAVVDRDFCKSYTVGKREMPEIVETEDGKEYSVLESHGIATFMENNSIADLMRILCADSTDRKIVLGYTKNLTLRDIADTLDMSHVAVHKRVKKMYQRYLESLNG